MSDPQASAAPSAGRAVDPEGITRAFLDGLRDEDVDGVMALLDDEVVYDNKGLPVLRGRRAVERVFRWLERPWVGFESHIATISTDGHTVHTERTDIHRFGRLSIQFWICGRYDVHGGKLTLIREYFDVVDVVRGTLRGVTAMAIPGLAPRRPGPDVPPGR